MENIAINIQNVKKSFKVYNDKGNTLKERLIFFKSRNAHTRHEVLKGVSLEINKGDVVGLVGQNGCGKSTLLKLMTRIIYPDSGSITVKGKVSSLLELGAGFHPDMSGRENIYINASIFGLTRKEIDSKIDQIIEFSELIEFIDSPVRTYSSGMYMRLAFSVAINVEAEILLIDEILAVGDANSQAKCFNKMQELKANGTTIVIVSHDLGSIERLCNKAVWIESGLIRDIGKPHNIAAQYLDKIMNKNNKIMKKSHDDESESIEEDLTNDKDENRIGNRYIEITEVELLDNSTKEVKEMFDAGSNITIRVKYKKNKLELEDCVFGFGILRNDGLNCYGTNSFIDNFEKIKLNEKGIVEINIEHLDLLEGEYFLDLAFHDEYGMPYDYIREAKRFDIYSKIKDSGVFRITHKFEHLTD